MASRRMMRSLDKIVTEIRNAGIISQVHLVLKMNKSVSTIEKARPYILECYHDISYENGMWIASKEEEVIDSTGH